MYKKEDKNVEFGGGGTDKGALFGVLLILVAIVGYVFFARPVAEDVNAMKNDLVAKNIEVEELRQEVALFEKAKEDLEAVTEVQRRESLQAVPFGMSQDDVIRDLLSIARGNDVVLRSVSFSRGSSGLEGVGILRINAGFEGSYDKLTSFLRGLENNARIFKVTSINVQVRQLEFVDLEMASFSLSIETFYQK